MNPAFTPPFWLRSTAVQTILASHAIRAVGTRAKLAGAIPRILHTRQGIRLLSLDLLQPAESARGVMILLHGWEGSSDSTYIRLSACAFKRQGYHVIRLNMRDHGPSHHLNEGIFLAIYLDEVFEAVQQIATRFKALPVYLCGFSLGGNFALRIASRCGTAPIENLRHVVAVSPVIDPYAATGCIDARPLLQRYFKRKWCRSLRLKQALFPHLYHFDDIPPHLTLMEMTDLLVPRYCHHNNARTYLNAYAVTPQIFRAITVPTTVFSAIDDPVIPIKGLRNLPQNPCVQRLVTPWGGHNGFIEGNPASAWYVRWMLQNLCPGASSGNASSG